MLLTAERIVIDGVPRSGLGIEIGAEGQIRAVAELSALGQPDHNLQGRVLVPGFVNAHSHAFQRLLRGWTQRCGPRTPSGGTDSFWTWREAMYRVARELDPEAMYVAARQAFVEMALNGVTTVGEFHYVHHQKNGQPYENPSAMAEAVVRAAVDVGLRICLLRTIYLRGGFRKPPNALQARFCEPDLDTAWQRVEALISSMRNQLNPCIGWGIAAHSVRAVPIDDLVSMKTCAAHLPMHIHVSEQQREVDGCLQMYGARPVDLLWQRGVLDGTTVLVHATHLAPEEILMIRRRGSQVCFCPSTEADLGDGLGPARDLFAGGVSLSLGTDGQTLSSILEEARRLEMHERLRIQQRNALGRASDDCVGVAALDAATVGGARALDMACGRIAPDHWADFVSFDLSDPHLAGHSETSLVPALVFSGDARAIRDVVVGGRFIVQDGIHPLAAPSSQAFNRLSTQIYG